MLPTLRVSESRNVASTASKKLWYSVEKPSENERTEVFNEISGRSFPYDFRGLSTLVKTFEINQEFTDNMEIRCLSGSQKRHVA